MVGYSCYLPFDFESGFSFLDLLFGVKLALNWFYSSNRSKSIF